MTEAPAEGMLDSTKKKPPPLSEAKNPANKEEVNLLASLEGLIS